VSIISFAHQQGVCHTKSLKAKKKEKLWKLKYFTMQKYVHLQNNPLNKETKVLQDIIIITLKLISSYILRLLLKSGAIILNLD
jgi:hypothetical protein